MAKQEFVMVKQFQYLESFTNSSEATDGGYGLQANLAQSAVHNYEEIPSDVVRIYSQVSVASDWGWRSTFELVLPFQEDEEIGKISLNSKLGVAVLGLSEGDHFTYELLGRKVELSIEKVEQSRKTIINGKSNDILKR